jgi:uncharacterized protein YciI
LRILRNRVELRARGFSVDMTDEEREIMQRHVAYWSGRLANGDVVVFGPVADPDGGWGVAVARAEDEAAVRQMIADDPVLSEGDGFSYDVFAMPGAIS